MPGPSITCHLQPVTGAAKDLPLSTSTQSSSGGLQCAGAGAEKRQYSKPQSPAPPLAASLLFLRKSCRRNNASPVLSPGLLSLTVQPPTPLPKRLLWNAESGRARGCGQLRHFPPTKSQKWQKVKAHQHVKTLVIIKTFLFCQISSWEKGQGLINGDKTRQWNPNSLCLHD